jgi:YHS domain-containing protein
MITMKHATPLRRALGALALAALSGCSSVGDTAPDTRPIAEDPVCLYNRDLPCVHVRVDEKTPRADYQGKTYYFCNDGCRVEFEKNPVKYVPREKGSPEVVH